MIKSKNTNFRSHYFTNTREDVNCIIFKRSIGKQTYDNNYNYLSVDAVNDNFILDFGNSSSGLFAETGYKHFNNFATA